MGNLFLNVMHMCDVLPCVLSFSVRGEVASNGVLNIKGVDQLFYLTKQKKLKITKKFNFPTKKSKLGFPFEYLLNNEPRSITSVTFYLALEILSSIF